MINEIIKIDRNNYRNTEQTTGMKRIEAFSQDDVWCGLVEMAPGEVSGWHHHGINDTYLHLVSGKAHFEFGVAGTERVEAFEGDFVFIPAGTIHREINPGDSVSCAVLFRTGGGIPVINLEGPYIEKSEI